MPKDYIYILQTILKVTLKFTKKLFLSDDGFGIFATDKDYSVKGYIIDDPASLIDTTLELEGYFEKSKKYSQTFCFNSYRQKSSNYYFLVNMVKGINESIAKDMINTFGDELYEIIEHSPSELLKIKGIGAKKLESIISSYKSMAHIRQLSEFLSSYGVSNSVILNIYRFYGDDSVEIIKDNPYNLTDIRGFGFKKADALAIKIGKKPQEEFRIQSGILYTFAQSMSLNGSTCLKFDTLFTNTCEILDIQGVFSLDEKLFLHSLKQLMDEKKVILENEFYIPFDMYEKENYIMDILEKYSTSQGDILNKASLEEMIEDKQKSMNISLSKEQEEAIRLANKRHSIFCICGYAGTGKSTISKIVLDLMSRHYPLEMIACCSLSGVAANRIKQLTGYESFTIHSLLGFKGGAFEFNKDNKLSHRVILLDEASMVNIVMFHSLLSAINFQAGAILILVGDVAQLPPIGAGDVYLNIIEEKLAPFVVLESIFRQKNQVIKLFASDIRKGQVPKEYMKRYDDFAFLPIAKNQIQNEQILQNILSIAREYQDMRYLYKKDTIYRYISYFQVISPIKSYLLGVNNLNKQLQKILNEGAKSKVEILSYEFWVKDKVIHLKNKNMPFFSIDEFKSLDINNMPKNIPLKRVFNGQRGVISHIDIENKYIFVFYPIEEYIIWYKVEDIKEHILDLAYAMSGHKTQGSEFENVVMPMTSSHFMMLYTKLVYTIITRAKEKLILVGDSNIFQMACKKLQSKNRDTLMKIRHSNEL